MQVNKKFVDNIKNVALETHPDKPNGSQIAFQRVQTAYDILSDLDKKQLYDTFGFGDKGFNNFRYVYQSGGRKIFIFNDKS